MRCRDGHLTTLKNVNLPMAGRHNVLNALAAIGIGRELGFPPEILRFGFEGFGGVKRRFTHVGSIATADGEATVIDDYGHHPVEIAAALSAAREGAGAGRVIAIVQPHRYSRLGELMDEFAGAFNDADHVLVLPVYAAGEEPVVGVDAEALASRLRDRGHREAHAVAGPDALGRQAGGGGGGGRPGALPGGRRHHQDRRNLAGAGLGTAGGCLMWELMELSLEWQRCAWEAQRDSMKALESAGKTARANAAAGEAVAKAAQENLKAWNRWATWWTRG